MQVSVVIPTYNRAHLLGPTLEAYLAQRGEHRILEVLVVDDGSTDGTAAVVETFRGREILIRYLGQENLGLSAARNHAVREAKGELILFGDDDIIPSPQMTAEHVAWHERHPGEHVGVLGFVPWLPAVKPTPFMKWSGLYGPQFNFGYFKPGGEVQFQHGYFCNTSVHASFLRRHGVFNEELRTYGYEDIELSYRLAAQGYKLLFNPAAVGYHNKRERLKDAQHRVEKLYASWPEFAKTAAGQEFLTMWRGARRGKAAGSKRWSKRALAPLKSAAVNVIRPIVDTQIPLPNWAYRQIFYHNITSFADVVEQGSRNPHMAGCQDLAPAEGTVFKS